MPPTTDEVRREIDKDEPNYPELAGKLGAEALPALHALVLEDDPRFAAKAAYLAGVIDGGADSAAIVDQAAQSRHHSIRVAAAAALPSVGEGAADTAHRLLADPDVGVRARAVKSAVALGDSSLTEKVADMAESDEHDAVREVARDAAGHTPSG